MNDQPQPSPTTSPSLTPFPSVQSFDPTRLALPNARVDDRPSGEIDSAYIQKEPQRPHYHDMSQPVGAGRNSGGGRAAEAPPKATRISGPTSEQARLADAPPGSLRVGGPTSESATAKTYAPGDMPPPFEPPLTRKQIFQLIRQLLGPITKINLHPKTMNLTQPTLPNMNPLPDSNRPIDVAEFSLLSNPPSVSPYVVPPSGGSDSMSSRASAVNETPPPHASSSAFSLQNSAFSLLQPDWVELSPYGDFPHPRGLQRIDREGAELIVAHFNSFWNKLGRRFAGVPIYIGHPDVPELQNEYPDKKAYGWITEVQVRTAGLYGKVKWSDAGLDLLQNAHYKFYSPFWEAQFIGEKEGKKIYRPTALISLGLTNQPNLPVLPLSNSAPTPFVDSLHLPSTQRPQSSHSGNLRESVKSAVKISFPSQPDNTCPATAAVRSSAPSAAQNIPNSTLPNSFSPQPSAFSLPPSLPLASEVLALQTLLHQRDERIHAMHANFENARAQWTQTQTQLQDDLATMRAAFDRLENSRIDLVLDQALRDGRIAPAERPLWNSQLKRDFQSRYDDLVNRPEIMHTKSITGDLGKYKIDLSNAENRQTILQELIAAKQKLGRTYHEAWSELKIERPDIFGAMNGNL